MSRKEPVETIPIDDTHRIVVYYDDSASDPRGEQEGISVRMLTQNVHYGTPGPGTDSLGGQVADIYAFNTPHYDALERFFAQKGVPYLAIELTAERDWVGQSVWYWEPEAFAAEQSLMPNYDGVAYLKGAAAEYQQWANGEVYGVVIEKLVTWQRLDPDGQVSAEEPSTRDVWERTSDAIWGCYLNDEYTAQQVAREQFGIEVAD